MNQRALVVGIDHYDKAQRLYGCVSDAYAVKAMLERHADGMPNFDVLLMTGTGPGNGITKAALRDRVQALFAGDEEIALLYFAGHGDNDHVGGYLVASDSARPDDGVGLVD